MILMAQVIDLVSKYSLTDIIIIGCGIFLAYKEIKKYVQEHQKEKVDDLKTYHETQKDIENKDSELNSRLSELEDHVGKDYVRIQKAESHLYQIEKDYKELKNTVNEMRIESLRSEILNAPSKCLDLTRPVSVDFYSEIYKKYEVYEQLLEETGGQNGQSTFSMNLVADSYEKRLAAGMFSEQLYLDPEEAKKKIRALAEKNASAPWWDKNKLNTVDKKEGK